MDPDESTPGKGRQQVATLMFKITGFDKSANGIEDVKTLLDDHGVWGATGGKNTYKRKGIADIQKSRPS